MEEISVIFLDFDGVLDTDYYNSDEQVEEKVKILADICHTFDAKVVISAATKIFINEETMEIDSKCKWVLYLFYLFNKYNIDVIGRTPDTSRQNENGTGIIELWKEDEIRLYLSDHPEIAHYCVIDDDDLTHVWHRTSDLNRVRDHLVETSFYNENNPLDEGIMPYHKEMIGEILKKENNVRDIAIMKRQLSRKK